MEVLWRKDLQNISWGFSGLEADFFNRSRSWLSELGGNRTLRLQSSFQNRQVIPMKAQGGLLFALRGQRSD
jgi:hypothetical protein